MRSCPYTPFVTRVDTPSEKLRRHLDRCEPCGLAALYSETTPQFHDKTSQCPDAATLAAFGEDLLNDDEFTLVETHVDDCGYCTTALRWANQDLEGEGEAHGTLEQAERELDAYDLAKEIADWLTAEKYPEEKDVVDTAFDVTYDALHAQLGATAKPDPVLALGLTGTRHTTASSIITLSILASRSLGSAATPAAGDTVLESMVTTLRRHGIAEGLVDNLCSAVKAVRAKP